MGPFLLSLTTVLYIVVCILLIIIVLMQESRGGGLASAFGGSGLDLAFGAGIGRKMSRFTVVLAVTFMILSIILAVWKAPVTTVRGAPAPTHTGAGAPAEPPATQPEESKESGEEAPAREEIPPSER